MTFPLSRLFFFFFFLDNHACDTFVGSAVLLSVPGRAYQMPQSCIVFVSFVYIYII